MSWGGGAWSLHPVFFSNFSVFTVLSNALTLPPRHLTICVAALAPLVLLSLILIALCCAVHNELWQCFTADVGYSNGHAQVSCDTIRQIASQYIHEKDHIH